MLMKWHSKQDNQKNKNKIKIKASLATIIETIYIYIFTLRGSTKILASENLLQEQTLIAADKHIMDKTCKAFYVHIT